MAVLKCTVCGGELEVNADMSVGVCKFCDAVITIPKELDRKEKLYNRAVFLRQNNEFDKAEAAYEDILKEDNSDAEAHWGLVLSKFGVEYVLDSKTQERIPTCHRTQRESLLSDPDYLAAIRYFDMSAREVIEKEARRIHKIQRKILEISQSESPYEVFICYKESDEQGNRTEDSLLAQDLYYELTKKGYKVFFARKTLESKLGSEYEPVIFAALSSARVMIVLGTRPEHFNAVWVRNEWSRFSKMSKDGHKVIIPAYRGMSPYELPVELSSLQSQDMSKLGFMQDLIDGIERCMRDGRKQENAQGEPKAISVTSSSLERFLQNGQTYLKLNNYASAEEVYITITKEYPEDYRGWWGLMVCKTRNFSQVLSERDKLNTWFKYVKQLAPIEEFKKLEKIYIEYAHKVSHSFAVEDMKTVENMVSEYSGKIKGIENTIRYTEQKCKNEIANVDNEIKKYRKGQEFFMKEDKKYLATICIGIIVMGAVVIMMTTGHKILGILILVFTGLPIMISGSEYSGSKSEADNYGKHIQREEEKKPEIKKKYDAQIVSLREEIPPLQSRISNCQKYLDLGEEKISSIWFEEECKKFEVQRIADNSIKECRKTVFGIINKREKEVIVELVSAEALEIEVAAELQKVMDIDLNVAVALAFQAPSEIKKCETVEEAEEIKMKLENMGAKVRLINN